MWNIQSLKKNYNTMIVYNKKLEIGDFIEQINHASDLANIAFVALKFDKSRPWFDRDHGTYNMIVMLLEGCLKELHSSKNKTANLSSGGIKVELFVDDMNIVNVSINLELL